jgi:hypothetical protein
MIFKDISHFNQVGDYLPILNGSINADLIIIFLLFHGFISSSYLKKWYKRFNLSASLADILILVIGIILTRFFYTYLFHRFNIFFFTGLALAIQIVHDFLFYLLFNNTPLGYNYMLDFFKSYAKEVGIGAVIGDSFMMILACLLSSYFATFSLNINIITLVVSCYFLPYMIYYQE